MSIAIMLATAIGSIGPKPNTTLSHAFFATRIVIAPSSP